MSIKILTYREHEEVVLNQVDNPDLNASTYTHLFKKRRGDDLPCYAINRTAEQAYSLSTGYFIGVDWIKEDKTALHIAPKINSSTRELDYISMLFSSLRHPEVMREVDELFEIKWEGKPITITQKQDLLTPFLVVEFLGLLKNIVRKGLKRSYYKVEQNLNTRIKGKILIGKSIKHNLIQNKKLYTYCTYEEFGLNNKENRLLKKALVFIKKYLPTYPQLSVHSDLQNTFNYINPAFNEVSDIIALNDIKHSKINAFYKDYDQALRLAKLILKRFGYNISNTIKEKIQTPPFWIDMSKLFELYVLGLLKDRFQNKVEFQFKHYGNELDYILKTDSYKMVIDAKYKLKYLNGYHNEDIRQVSGYARLRKVYDYLFKDKAYDKIIDCLIIYPDQDNGVSNLLDIDLKKNEISAYVNVYKIGIALPVIENHTSIP